MLIVLPSNGIEVTEEENADIEDIISMGFSKEDSIEAYFTCDKNKEMAINYLFEAKENGTLLCKLFFRDSYLFIMLSTKLMHFVIKLNTLIKRN